MTMIERVAVAIGEKIQAALAGGPPVALNEVARAAIEAMREPTEFMVDQASCFDGRSTATAVWHSMIDDALAEKAP